MPAAWRGPALSVDTFLELLTLGGTSNLAAPATGGQTDDPGGDAVGPKLDQPVN